MKLFGQLLIVSLLCLLGTSSSFGADHIKDNLKLFSDNAKQMANQQIDQLYKNHGWMIAVETRDAAATIPDLPEAKSEQADFLKSWAKKQYDDNGIKGIYLVIFKNPTKFNFYSEPKLEQRMGVTQADKRSWENLLTDNLREHKFDLALLSAVGNMSNKLSRTNAAKSPTTPAAPAPAVKPGEPVADKAPAGHEQAHPAADDGSSMMMWLLVAGAGFVIFLIIRSVLRGMNQGNAGYNSPNQYGPGGSNMGQPGYGPGYGAPSGGRGGGFMSGMLGGLFGGMAGNWMYDQMSGRRDSHSDSGQGHLTSHDSDSSSGSESTSYGGDWGNDSSGDSGGGGGDWGGGGGDSGGDSGGGGGDW